MELFSNRHFTGAEVKVSEYCRQSDTDRDETAPAAHSKKRFTFHSPDDIFYKKQDIERDNPDTRLLLFYGSGHRPEVFQSPSPGRTRRHRSTRRPLASPAPGVPDVNRFTSIPKT